MLTKYLLISLFVAAQPGNHDIAMTYDHITTTDTAEHCELLAKDLQNLGYPPLHDVVIERINMCVQVDVIVPEASPQQFPNADKSYTLVSQAAYKWSGHSKPISIFSVTGLVQESCVEAVNRLAKITHGHRAAYNYTRIDSICI